MPRSNLDKVLASTPAARAAVSSDTPRSLRSNLNPIPGCSVPVVSLLRSSSFHPGAKSEISTPSAVAKRRSAGSLGRCLPCSCLASVLHAIPASDASSWRVRRFDWRIAFKRLATSVSRSLRENRGGPSAGMGRVCKTRFRLILQVQSADLATEFAGAKRGAVFG